MKHIILVEHVLLGVLTNWWVSRFELWFIEINSLLSVTRREYFPFYQNSYGQFAEHLISYWKQVIECLYDAVMRAECYNLINYLCPPKNFSYWIVFFFFVSLYRILYVKYVRQHCGIWTITYTRSRTIDTNSILSVMATKNRSIKNKH